MSERDARFITREMIPTIIRKPKSTWIVGEGRGPEFPSCSCCDRQLAPLVQVEPDDEYSGALLCIRCLRDAVSILEAALKDSPTAVPAVKGEPK